MSASTMWSGVGRSGSPMPRLITSTPRALSAARRRSSSANMYGGILCIRRATRIGPSTGSHVRPVVSLHDSKNVVRDHVGGAAGIDPSVPRVRPEPGPLALRVPACVLPQAGNRLAERHPTHDVRHQLLVPERL